MRAFSVQALLATVFGLLFFLETAQAAVCSDYFLWQVGGKGVAPNAPAGYKTYRSVKDYGAKGDGRTDDTAAIQRAISSGNRCGPGCTGSTTTPALIFFPAGTYIISAPIIDYYYTQIMGNPISGCSATIKAAPGFQGRWLVDGNPYGSSGSLAWGATNVFWRLIANINIDTTALPASREVAALHWPTSQSTSLSNMVFRMAQGADSKHQGLFIEEGSGGYMGDLVFHGGGEALAVGNQQFTMRNLTINNAQTAIKQLWSWGWTYQGININNCRVGFDFTAANGNELSVGGAVILDSQISNTPVGITYGNSQGTSPPFPNNFVVENLAIRNVPTAIRDASGTVVAGTTGSRTIAAWGRGNSYIKGQGPTSIQSLTPNARPADLLSGSKYYARSKPTYENLKRSDFITARVQGAKGDGVTDDTAAINRMLASAVANNKVVYFDAGIYRVTSTIKIPPGSRITGESWPIILSSGAYFNNMASPKPVVQIGNPGQAGKIEWSNMIVSTKGAQAGAIMIQYNLASGSRAPSGMWDVHVRIGGFASSDLQLSQCRKTPGITATKANIPARCVSGFLSMHVTKQSSGLLMENCWFWVADHDMEIGANNEQITVYAGRGMLIESTAGSLWLYGTSVEHHQRYEYHLVKTRGVVMGQIQTETAYYQNNPDATLPFPHSATYSDPNFNAGESGWGLRIIGSRDVLVYGAGLYSFFDNNDVTCSQIGQGARCQSKIFSVMDSTGPISVYNLNTVGANKMLTYNGVNTGTYSLNRNGFISSIALVRN